MGHRRDLDLTLLWLWCRPVATGLIRPLAWESPYAEGVVQEKAKRHAPPKKRSNIKFGLWVLMIYPNKCTTLVCDVDKLYAGPGGIWKCCIFAQFCCELKNAL